MFADKIKAKYERLHVSLKVEVKVEPSCLILALYIFPLFYLHD